MHERSPEHVLNASGTACIDSCPACQWLGLKPIMPLKAEFEFGFDEPENGKTTVAIIPNYGNTTVGFAQKLEEALRQKIPFPYEALGEPVIHFLHTARHGSALCVDLKIQVTQPDHAIVRSLKQAGFAYGLEKYRSIDRRIRLLNAFNTRETEHYVQAKNPSEKPKELVGGYIEWLKSTLPNLPAEIGRG